MNRGLVAARSPSSKAPEKANWHVQARCSGASAGNTDEPAAVTKKYVENAVNDMLAGKEVSTPMTKAIGCTIKWKK